MPDTQPKVAVVTRTRDRPLLLRRAMASVLAQTAGSWVHVIVNDGGDPGPVDSLVEEFGAAYAGRVRVLHNPRSTGMEAASNRGVRESESDYVAIHDDDDTWHPEFLETMVGVLDAREGSVVRGAVCHSVLVEERIEGGGVEEVRRRSFNAGLAGISLPRLARDNLFPPISFVFDRAAAAAVGPFDESLPVLGDWEFNLRFCAEYEIEVVRRELAFWHHRLGGVDPSYANSVNSRLAEMQRARDAIVNARTRAALRAGASSLGGLVAAGDQFYALERSVVSQTDSRLEALAEELRQVAQRQEAIVAQLQSISDELDGVRSRVEALHALGGRMAALAGRWPFTWLRRLLSR